MTTSIHRSSALHLQHYQIARTATLQFEEDLRARTLPIGIQHRPYTDRRSHFMPARSSFRPFCISSCISPTHPTPRASQPSNPVGLRSLHSLASPSPATLRPWSQSPNSLLRSTPIAPSALLGGQWSRSRRSMAVVVDGAASPAWTPANAVAASCGKFFSPSPDFTVALPKGRGSLNSIMLRQSTLDVMSAINGEIKRGTSKTKICIDGRPGSGKTAALSIVASHYQKLGWIVVSIPDVAYWVSGKEPYAFVKESGLFTQNTIASRVAGEILRANSDALSKIPTKDGGNLANLLKQGQSRPTTSHAVIDEFLSSLLVARERPPVLFSIDSVNALYAKTAYYDVDSSVLTADRFALMKSFINVLTKNEIENGAVVCATNHSDPAIRSPLFRDLIEEANELSLPAHKPATGSIPSVGTLPSRPRRIPPIAAENADLVGAGVVLPENMAPGMFHPLFARTDLHPAGLARFEMPRFSRKEMGYYLRHCKAVGTFHDDLTDGVVLKICAVTGGDLRQVRSRYLV
ncbi:mitochondrial ribosomal death-associated protein 3-domain-containing protein [Zopfochytrium polystomum]|nr:mitochondrial ribosomal death-associated protein 3-domain-containing protein [Zopfochytrium polystomum]